MPSLVAGACGALLVGACSGGDDSDVSSPESLVVDSTSAPVDSSGPVESELPADVTPSGVILAATLIASGNIEDAVASGLVTPAEVDEARAAIESGTLDRWVDLAERK